MNRSPSAWEAQMVAEWRQRCKTTAASILGLWRIGYRVEDAEQSLTLSVVEACRSWANQSESKPPPKFINCALRRRKFRLWERIKAATIGGVNDRLPEEVEDQGECPARDQQKSAHSPESTLQKKQELEAAKAVLSSISLVLSPSEMALLRLRCEGRPHLEIAHFLNDQHAAKTLKWKLHRTKKKARNFLNTCGIVTSEDVFETSKERQSEIYKKAEKQSR